jgi:hypothetical protein
LQQDPTERKSNIVPLPPEKSTFDYTCIKINGNDIHYALVDNACNISCIDSEYAKSLSLTIQPAKSGMIHVANLQIPRLGTVILDLEHGTNAGPNKLSSIQVEVIKHASEKFIIGKDLFQPLGITLTGLTYKPPLFTRESQDDLQELFREPVQTPWTALPLDLQNALLRNRKINMIDTFCTHPLAKLQITLKVHQLKVFNNRNYVSKPEQREAVNKEFERYIKEGHMAEVNYYPTTCFAYLAVPKRDDSANITGWRPCIDMKPANKFIEEDPYPMPRMEEVLKVPLKHKGPDTRRSKIDLTGAFNRVEIEDDSCLVYIYWRNKYWKMKRAFFGISTMPALFQRIMDAISQEILEDYKFIVKSYLDDTFNEGGSVEEDLRQSIIFVDTCTKYNLRINEEKSYWSQHTLPGLGKLVGGSGMQVHPSKIEKIKNWRRPQSGKDISSFLGTVNWPRKHMPRIAWVTAPLDALRNQKKIEWNGSLETSFQLIKELANLSANLVTYDESKEVLIGTDASAVGLGYWQGQAKDKFRNVKSSILMPH